MAATRRGPTGNFSFAAGGQLNPPIGSITLSNLTVAGAPALFAAQRQELAPRLRPVGDETRIALRGVNLLFARERVRRRALPLRRHIDAGFRFLGYGMDVRILDTVCRRDLATLRDAHA